MSQTSAPYLVLQVWDRSSKSRSLEGVAQASGLPRMFPEVKQPIFINFSIFSPESIGNLWPVIFVP
jgi:hypothetical protein